MASSIYRITVRILIALAAGPLLQPAGMAAPDETGIAASAAITSSNPSSDKALAIAVAEAVSKALGDSTVKNLKVQSSDGEVTLSGWLNSPNQESLARKIASNVSGTSKVYSRIRIWSTEANP